jgi:acyl-CoA thioester hydrolase
MYAQYIRVMSIADLLAGYPVVVAQPVAWGDMDAFQHVNNTRYFRWFEDARIAYFAAVGLDAIQAESGIGPILSATQCRFRVPLTYPDRVSIGGRVAKLEEQSFVMQYAVVSHERDKLAAEGEGTLVAYDYRALKKAVYTAELRARIVALEGKTPPPV